MTHSREWVALRLKLVYPPCKTLQTRTLAFNSLFRDAQTCIMTMWFFLSRAGNKHLGAFSFFFFVEIFKLEHRIIALTLPLYQFGKQNSLYNG